MAEKSSAMKMLDFEQAGWAEAGIAFQNLFMKFWRRHENLKFYLMSTYIYIVFLIYKNLKLYIFKCTNSPPISALLTKLKSIDPFCPLQCKVCMDVQRSCMNNLYIKM